MSDVFAVFHYRDTPLACVQMAQDLLIRLNQQFIAQIRVHEIPDFAAIVWLKIKFIHDPWPPLAALLKPYDSATPDNFSLSIARPRLNRDITVPIGTLRIFDTSLYANSCTSASKTTSRYFSGIP